MSERIKIGLIGCGTHAHWAVIPAIRAMTGGRLAAVAEPRPEQTADLADPEVAIYTDYRVMLDRESLDLVYVATPCDAHCECVLAALESGCHVACEKPMAMTVADCRRMVATAEKQAKLLAIDFETRYLPAHRQVRRWIADDRIGAVRAIHIDAMWDGHKRFGPLADRRRAFLDRSGCLDCGIHKLDIARFYAGGGDWQEIRALGAWFSESVRYPPHIAIQALLSPGIIVTLNDSFACTAAINAKYRHQSIILLGEDGVIALESDGNQPASDRFHLVSASLEATCPLGGTGHTGPITAFLEDLARTLTGQQTLPAELPTAYDGLAAQIAVETANNAAVLARDGGAGAPRA